MSADATMRREWQHGPAATERGPEAEDSAVRRRDDEAGERERKKQHAGQKEATTAKAHGDRPQHQQRAAQSFRRARLLC